MSALQPIAGDRRIIFPPLPELSGYCVVLCGHRRVLFRMGQCGSDAVGYLDIAKSRQWRARNPLWEWERFAARRADVKSVVGAVLNLAIFVGLLSGALQALGGQDPGKGQARS